MAESSWPLPPGAVVSDLQHEQLFSSFVPSALYGGTADTSIVTALGTGTRLVTIRLGKYALVRGHMWYSGTSDFQLASLASNGSGNPRDDLIVLRYTRSTGAVTAAAITGVAAASPVPPTPTQNLGTSGVYEVPIAVVRVASGATTLTSGNVTARDVYLSRGPLIGTSSNVVAFPGAYVGQEADIYDSSMATLLRHWWTGSAWMPRGGQLIKAVRNVSGTPVYTGFAEAIAYTYAVPAGVFVSGGAYLIEVEATLTCVTSPSNTFGEVILKDGTTVIGRSGTIQVYDNGFTVRRPFSAIVTPASSASVTYNVTAGRTAGTQSFNVATGTETPFMFSIRTFGSAAQVSVS